MHINISIIMPVYNAETFLHRSIKSIINQTYQDWELIIIDDGSTDNSSLICDSYADSDNRIRVIHKKNEGVSVARQLGINEARGKYSIHVDSDDWIEPTMLEYLYNYTIPNNYDIVITDFFQYKNGKEIYCKQIPTSLDSYQVLQDLFKGKLFGALWNKLIRTDLYKKYNAKFFKGINYCADLLLLVQLLQHENITISYYPQAFYHYVSNPNSITRNYTYETYKTRLKFRDKLKEVLKCSNSNEILDNVSFGIFIEAFIFNVLSKDEINEGLIKYRYNIKKIEGIRWKLGFLFLKLGFYRISQQFIHY